MVAPRIEWPELLERDGFAVVPSGLAATDLATIAEALDSSTQGKSRAGVRDLLAVPEIRAVAISPTVRSMAVAVLGSEAIAVRAILFDKTADANWKVAWHQDLTIAVRQRWEVAGFGPWSTKAGIPHVQPPVSVLERVVALRLHLDECGPSNGPIRFVPGTHRLGRLSAEQAREARARLGEVVCTAHVGDVILMRPLVLHASSPATNPDRRRVVHLEYGSRALPGGLDWHEHYK